MFCGRRPNWMLPILNKWTCLWQVGARLGFWVRGLGAKVQDFNFRIEASGFLFPKVDRIWLWVYYNKIPTYYNGSGCRVWSKE